MRPPAHLAFPAALRRALVVVALALAAVALAAVASSALAQPEGATPTYPRGGVVKAEGGDLTYEFVTRPDSAVVVRSSRGDSLLIEPWHLRQIAAAYGGDPDNSAAAVQAGYDVEDGALTVYLSRRLPVEIALALLALGVVAAVVFAVWAVRRIRTDARRKRELEAFRETLATAREGERVRLARELHDGPLQELHVLRLRLAAAQDADSEGDLLSAIGEVRRVVEDLRPPDLDRYGLGDAVGALARRFRERNPGVALEAEVDVDDQAVRAYGADLQLTLYRLAQEALSNVAEHAGASRVRLALTADGRRYALAVEDDGAGFEPGEAGAGGGRFGLVGMAERAEAASARLSVESWPGAGTRLRVTGVPPRP